MKHLLIIFLFFAEISSAQIIHYSSSSWNDLANNPANTGNFSGDVRMVTIHRKQYGNFIAPYYSSLFSIDMPIYYYSQKINIGCMYNFDNNKAAAQSTHLFYPSIAYQVKLTKNSELKLGMYCGLYNKNSRNSELTKPDQYDRETGAFNNSLPTMEYLQDYNIINYDAGFGGLIIKNISTTKIVSGFSLFQLNRPIEYYGTSKYAVPIQKKINLTIEKTWKKTICLFEFDYTHLKTASEVNTGIGIIYYLKPKTALILSARSRFGFERNADAAIISFGIKQNNWEYKFSYDYDISFLHNITTKHNAFEINIVYTRPSTYVEKQKTKCEIL